MKNVIKSVKGTRDFYPDKWQNPVLIRKLTEASEAFGYQMYDGPCLETIDLYAAKSGKSWLRNRPLFSTTAG